MHNCILSFLGYNTSFKDSTWLQHTRVPDFSNISLSQRPFIATHNFSSLPLHVSTAPTENTTEHTAEPVPPFFLLQYHQELSTQVTLHSMDDIDRSTDRYFIGIQEKVKGTEIRRVYCVRSGYRYKIVSTSWNGTRFQKKPKAVFRKECKG
jgi:hypothetical protein